MIKTAKKGKETSESVVVTFDLFDLPTAQHKAGLAGMLLQIRDMESLAKQDSRIQAEAIPRIRELEAVTATIEFTERSVQGLMDEAYSASEVEVAVKSKWQGQAPKREKIVDERDEKGDVKKIKHYIYDQIQPTGRFLQGCLQDDKGLWIKLWRDMLWAIPRGNPQSRQPFEQRASGKPCKEGPTNWRELVKAGEARRKNTIRTSEVSGSLWLGAQATNAELLPFEGRSEHNLLLHFWPLTALVFVPQHIDADGASQFVGYALAIPEVADLVAFMDEYPRMLSQLSASARGYRPAEAVIDLPAESALAFFEHLARLSSEKATSKIGRAVGSIDYLHLAKFGNNIKTMAAGRIANRPGLLDGYLAIVGRPGEDAAFRNPLFRRALILSLLNDQEWYAAMPPMLAQMPSAFFVRSEESPRNMPWFWHDAAKKFQTLSDNYRAERREFEEMLSTDSANAIMPQTPLPVLINRLVQAYILRKTEERSGCKWDDFKDKKVKDETTGKERIAVPEIYREAREKIASSIFLEMRSRRDQAFVDHFTATFCSVKQFLPEQDFRVIADALLLKPDDVKTLTLLALSANS